MNSRERMAAAMTLQVPDRVPVMCQLSLGHYFLQAGLKPFEVWFTSEGFAEALVRLQHRYGFDGVLINLPGRPPDIERYIDRYEPGETEDIVHWKNGGKARLPHDDNAHYVTPDGRPPYPRFEDVDPARLHYVEAWDATGIKYPHRWDFEKDERPFDDYFPFYVFDTIKAVMRKARGEVSVHSEIFSPFSQLLELLGYESALVALMDDAAKAHACLDRLTAGAIDLGRRQARCGVDAVLISSAFAGRGFIGRDHYAEFVLPYERRVVEGIKAERDVPVYTHTCGAIGDRLDLMVQTGTHGVDTLDPPPLGTVELDEAKRFLAGKTFIKGNIDSVNTLLKGEREAFVADVRRRLEIGKPGGGYILSSACSVAPRVEPERLAMLAELAERHGRYA